MPPFLHTETEVALQENSLMMSKNGKKIGRWKLSISLSSSIFFFFFKHSTHPFPYNNKMFNPIAQFKIMADELQAELSPNASTSGKLGIIESMFIKLLFSALIVVCAYIYFDKNSVLNGNTPEENQRLHKIDYNKEMREKYDKEDQEENERKAENKDTPVIESVGVSTGQSSSTVKSRKT